MANLNNRTEIHQLTLEEVRLIHKEYAQKQQERNGERVSALDLCRYDSLRGPTVLIFVLHLFVYYSFSMPELALRDFSSSIFVNGVVIGCSEVVGRLL